LKTSTRFLIPVLLASLILLSLPCHAEESDSLSDEPAPTEKNRSRSKKTYGDKRKYFHDEAPRSDAGVFHVAFAAGGNFYIEPQVNTTTNLPTGNYFRDFGFQTGVYFDLDYSQLDENIPLMLRGMVGYRYILASVHQFAFDGIVRHMFRFSENASFGLGVGTSIGLWYRVASSSANEETLVLPSFVVEGGFDFDPFMVDVKWMINRFGPDNVITGFELYFGFRL
jgi:hypothetical protein